MNFIRVLFLSFVLFILVRVVMFYFSLILLKIFKIEETNPKWELILSIALLFIYLGCLGGALNFVIQTLGFQFSLLDNFLGLTSMGMFLVIWIYCSWDINTLSMPHISTVESEVFIKKVVIFLLVMVISFVSGYYQMRYLITKQEVVKTLSVTTVSIVPGILVFDRVISLLYTWHCKNLKRRNDESE